MRLIETSLDDDLSEFSRWLWQHRVVHRVFEERGRQILELRDPAQQQAVREAYAAWRDGRLPRLAEGGTVPPPASGGMSLPARLARYPVLVTLIAAACLVFPFSLPLTDGRLSAVAAALLIIDPHGPWTELPTLPVLLAELQVWRWVGPILLHFSVLHLAFNCAVVIELGRRVEGRAGSVTFAVVILFMAVASNLTQYAAGGSPVFGGLSGVAYGLLGFILVKQRLQPHEPAWALPKGITLALLAFLVIFTTGITEPFGLHVANAAHWSGLIAGAVAAFLSGAVFRKDV